MYLFAMTGINFSDIVVKIKYIKNTIKGGKGCNQ